MKEQLQSTHQENKVQYERFITVLVALVVEHTVWFTSNGEKQKQLFTIYLYFFSSCFHDGLSYATLDLTWFRVCERCGRCYWKGCWTNHSWLPISVRSPLFPFCTVGEESDYERTTFTVFLMMSHRSDIIKPSFLAEPIGVFLGSDSSIREADWDAVWRGAVQGQIKDDRAVTPFSWQLLKACLPDPTLTLPTLNAHAHTPTVSLFKSKHESLLSKSSLILFTINVSFCSEEKKTRRLCACRRRKPMCVWME